MSKQNDSELEIFKTQSDLFLEAADILDEMVVLIEDGTKNADSSDDLSKEQKLINNTISIFKTRSIQIFVNVLKDLSREITNDKSSGQLLLPHMRTILDIHAKFIHLEEKCSSDLHRALLCFAYQALTYSKIPGFESIYSSTLSIYSSLLESESIDFPKQPEDLKIGWLNKNKLLFASRSELLTEDLIKKYSGHSLEVYTPSKTYDIYCHLSELAHGNPYYDHGPGNERFWIVSMVITTTASFMEIVDKYSLNRNLPRKYRIWLKKVKENRPAFLKEFSKRRKST